MIGPSFFDAIRRTLAGGSLKQAQVDGFNTLSTAWDQDGDTDIRKLAYIFATAWHETAQTMQPIAEYGKGAGRPYGRPDATTGKVYYGRGFVQLTWLANYKRAGDEVGVDLVNDPDRAMDPAIAAPVAVKGMMEGWFTGKSLGSYFNATTDNPVQARRIINGVDKATLISAYHMKFLAALKASS